MNNQKFLLLGIFLLLSSFSFGQLNFTVNSLADDQSSYPYDKPETPDDESIDGICEDELGRCTLSAAYGESLNMQVPVNISFSVNGTINLMNGVFLFPGSTIDGGHKIELQSNFVCMSIDSNTTVKGLTFKGGPVTVGLTVEGRKNKIGILRDGNTFIDCQVGMVISGDSNEVYSNLIGIDSNKVLHPNRFGIITAGNYNAIGKIGYYGNTICGSYVAGIILGGSETGGKYNRIRGNQIGTTIDGAAGLGNVQGIVVEGASNNFIEENVISGNSLHGIFISGAPPETNAPSNQITNNVIGISFYQDAAIPNKNGIVISNAAYLTTIHHNVIAGNDENGILILGINDTLETKYHLITDNKIGVNTDLVNYPNGNGISVIGKASEIWIGASLVGSDPPNTIVGNLSGGIIVKSDSAGLSPNKIEFRKNIINQNAVTNLLVEPSANSGIQPPFDLSFSGSLLTGIHQYSNTTIDIYDANILESPPSAYRWLGSAITDANGIFAFDIIDPLVEAVSVTASDNSRGTSSFAYYDIVTNVENENKIPADFLLQQNYPNPFNPSTTISFELPVESHVILKIYNAQGEEVKTLLDSRYLPGQHTALWDGTNNKKEKVSSGVYFIRMRTEEFITVKKAVLMR